MPHLGLVTLVVPGYDEAVAFYVDTLGFELVEDTPVEDTGVEDTRVDGGKRWVVVAPRGARETRVLLARADGPEQSARVGDQTGGRVGWFLETGDFDGDHARMRAAGVVFEEAPRDEPYGRVAVFRDPYGNRWDLIGPGRSGTAAPADGTGTAEADAAPADGTGTPTEASRTGTPEAKAEPADGRRGAHAEPEPAPWPVATGIETARLALEPLRVSHAPEAFPVLADERLHIWTGGSPPSFEQLEVRYRRQAAGHSPDGGEGWLNWMLRRLRDGQLVGTVQATLHRPAAGLLAAEVAWVVGSDHQGNGYASEGALAMARWLRDNGVDWFAAHIHPDHAASAAVARALGLTPTDTVVDGETRWSGDGRSGDG